MSELRKIKRALLSVSDKAGILDLAKELNRLNVEIISTGGTAKALRENGLAVTEVSEITGFPEMMDGRVKTLHPKIHGAFLALRDNDEHLKAMKTHDITPIDLVVVNLYPFEKTIENENVSLEEAVEQIDIGGPAMIRSASKNWRDVAVITDPRIYEKIIVELNENNGAISLETRKSLAALAFSHTSYYDLIISDYLTDRLSDEEFELVEDFHPSSNEEVLRIFDNLEEFENGETTDEDLETEEISGETEEGLPDFIDPELEKSFDLRYGENPHQQSALYVSDLEVTGIAYAEQLHGKEMSYNNYLDADAAWRLIQDFDELACAIIKHTNPSGVGIGENNLEAYKRALETDPVSAFGGIVAFNKKVSAAEANAVNEVFTEVVIAPEYEMEALEIFKKKKNLRVLKAENVQNAMEYRKISGGMLVQTPDAYKVSIEDLKIVTEKQPTAAELKALQFAWKVCKHVKSNAIVFTNEFQTVGVGAGQMNRIDSVRIAAERAGRTSLELKSSVLASDAFFPFRDGVDEAAKYGISAIIQPGGSVRDEEVIEAANEHGLAMVFTGIRHFKH